MLLNHGKEGVSDTASSSHEKLPKKKRKLLEVDGVDDAVLDQVLKLTPESFEALVEKVRDWMTQPCLTLRSRRQDLSRRPPRQKYFSSSAYHLATMSLVARSLAAGV